MKDESLQQSKGCISIAYNFPRLNQEEIENLDRLITSEKSEIVIKNLPANKNSRPDGFTGEFYKTLKEQIIPVLYTNSCRKQMTECYSSFGICLAGFPVHIGKKKKKKIGD